MAEQVLPLEGDPCYPILKECSNTFRVCVPSSTNVNIFSLETIVLFEDIVDQARRARSVRFEDADHQLIKDGVTNIIHV